MIPLRFHIHSSLEAQYYNIQCGNSTGLIKVIILHLRGCHSCSHTRRHTQAHTSCLAPLQLYDVNNPIRSRLSNSLLSRSAHKAGNIHTRLMTTAGPVTRRLLLSLVLSPSATLDLPHTIIMPSSTVSGSSPSGRD